jgi:hypothetical protein
MPRQNLDLLLIHLIDDTLIGARLGYCLWWMTSMNMVEY